MAEGMLGYDISKVYTAAQVTANNPNDNIPPLGTIFTDGRNNKRYKFCKTSSVVAANDFVVRDYAATDEPNTVQQNTAVAQPIAGVSPNAIANGGAGWIQIHGEYPTANVAASTAGQMLGTTATAGRATGITMTTPTTAESLALMAATQQVRATALDVAAANLCQVYLAGE